MEMEVSDSSNPKLLMFSDIEGCQKFNLAGPKSGGILQSGFLCNPAFYAEIKRRLDSDKNLHIAFLGDYFDQGMGVYESINGMDRLLTEFNKEGEEERVFVILGNRDVNKLRFCFELAKEGIVGLEKGNRWEFGFGAFYDNLNDKTDVALANCILFYSMGAKIDMDSNSANGAPNAKLIGLHSFIPPGKDINDSKLALQYLKVSLGIEPRDGYEDALDLLGFFRKCKIAHVFDGTLGKVLLAHGGGFDPDAFFDKAYVDSFGQVGDITAENYHSTLERFRRKLSGDVQKGGYNRKFANAYGNMVSQQNMADIDRTQAMVEPSVDVYNNLLQDVLYEVSEGNFTWKFVLLQALGLKPDSEDARYKSLIQSCSQDGCSGPNKELSNDGDSSKLAKILKDSGITHVSYGHKPICFPIPVIYQRKGIDGVTFISNDTSNGNRKVEEIGENTAIGTMVIFDPNGVKSKIEPVELNGREAKVGNYSAMYDPLTLDTTPFYEIESGANVLKYGNGKVVFNKSGYNQLNYIGSSNSGGKRRSRHRKQHKSKRGSKRGGSKKTIHRRRHKHTKRGRKARK